ncbi:MAG TPA: hypothetical protein VIL74_10775 [Pyrinomonadaceae bacterium]|jgi:hypothetical protein
MKNLIRFGAAVLLIFAFLTNALPCGPSYVSPVFEYDYAPENPYENFAAGKIGVLKPSQRRIVLLAAYRYLNGGGFSAPEQKALVEVWNAEFNNRPYEEDDVGETVKQWIEKRKSVVGKEEKTPEIYVEREYGNYDFFPNCTKSAFETAIETLSDRAASHGSEDPFVRDWVAGQDKVFENCASGKATPAPLTEAMPEWLRKDRAYQLAASEFYALDYDSARRHFAEIAQDYDSPWQETAEYLVARTLIRQASLIKNKTNSEMLYAEAEQNFSNVAAKGSKFSNSANKMLGLIKYRLRPQERVRELAQIVATQGDANFRQDLIDYNWLLDKFEKETLEAEDKRREQIKQLENSNNVNAAPLNDGAGSSDSNTASTVVASSNSAATNANSTFEQPQNDAQLRIYIYSDDYKENWTFFVEPDATDDEAIAKAEQIVGRPLSDKMRELVRSARREAYRGRFDGNGGGEYQGGYYGSEKLSLSILPDFLRNDDLTNWLFTFQTAGSEAYLYAISRFRETGSNLWLLTAVSKAEKSSAELNRLLEAADKVDRNSPAYPTIAYHRARILIEAGKTAEARKLLDDILDSGLDLPVSSRNKFLLQRAQISETLDDFLRFARLKPFAFDWDGTSGTIDDFIKQQKSWYTPESYPNQTRAQYEQEVEENFKNERLWQDREMFDSGTINVMNNHFPLALLVEAEQSPALPDYLRERFAIAAWTRAVLLGDYAIAAKISPEVVKFHPALEESIGKVNLAKTPTGKQRAAFYLILKNPMFSPYLEDGLGKADNEFNSWDANDWWCAPYDTEYDATTGTDVKVKPPPKPRFLSAAQSGAAQDERKKLAEIGDAPKFFGEKTLEWTRLAPADKRVPELLFIAWEANGWTKYGCGNNVELRQQLGDVLKKKYPQSEFAQKVRDEEKEQ